MELGVGIGEGGAEPPRIVTLDMAMKWFAEHDPLQDASVIREQWLYYDAQRNSETGEWQKPRGNLGHVVRVSDWRSELARACLRFGDKKNAGGATPGKPSRSPAQARFELSRELEAVQDRLEAAYQTGALMDTRDQNREKEIEHELNQLQEGAA